MICFATYVTTADVVLNVFPHKTSSTAIARNKCHGVAFKKMSDHDYISVQGSI